MRYQPLLPSFLLLFAVGCSADRRTFNVAVKNDTDWALSLALTKDVPQSQYFWASPEDLVDARVILLPDQPIGGRVDDVEPGRMASVRNISGTFPDGVHAVLRVYRGKRLSLRDQLSIEPGSDRQDVPLSPGDNLFVVHDTGGKLSVERQVVATK